MKQGKQGLMYRRRILCNLYGAVDFLPLEGAGPETHVHKISIVPVFYMALGLNDFDMGNFITQDIGRGGP